MKPRRRDLRVRSRMKGAKISICVNGIVDGVGRVCYYRKKVLRSLHLINICICNQKYFYATENPSLLLNLNFLLVRGDKGRSEVIYY